MGDASSTRGRARPARHAWWFALVAGLAVLALGLAGAWSSRDLAHQRRATADQAAVGATAVAVATDLERGLDVVGTTAVEASLPGAIQATNPALAGAVPGAQAVGIVGVDGATAPGVRSPLSDAVLRRPEVAALLDRARDSGVAVASAPMVSVDGGRMLLVAAAYEPGASPGMPRSTQARRERLIGWVVADVDLDVVVAQHVDDGAVGAVLIDGLERRVPARLPDQTIDVRGRSLTITAGDPSRLPVGSAATLLLVVAIGGALVAALGVLTGCRRLRTARQEAQRTADQVRLIGEVAPVVQQSLDLGEVLPEVALQLSDHFGLDGVRLSAGSSPGGQVELFSLGVRQSAGPTPVLHAPTHLEAGQVLALALQRGGRSVALLELVAGRALDEADLQSLRAISELVTAAVVNASLFASQQDAVRRLRDLDALKNVFLSTASHELRTPATAISGFANLLTGSWDRFDDDQRRDFAERISANARSLTAVVQDLLDFSLLDRGTVPLALVDVELDRVVEGVVDRLSPLFSDHVIDCSTEPGPPVAAEVNGLERVVTNLLTNAVKFSPAGSTVTVTVAPLGAGAQLTVSDEGPGVPSEERQRIFTRFYRGTSEAVVQTRGVGIGLSVVAELVARMSGQIVVDEAPGGGASFRVWLPSHAPQLEHAPPPGTPSDGTAAVDTQDAAQEVTDASTR